MAKKLTCNECGYVWRSKTVSNSSGLCRKCYKARHQQLSVAKDPLAYWRNWLKYRYNLTVEQYDDMLLAQDGRCAICRGCDAHERLHVDHDHRTGTIRGLLCNNCNRGIGHLKENISSLKAAIRYLRDAATPHAVPKGGQ